MTPKLICASVAASAALFAIAPSALASTATISAGTRVTVTGAGNERNQIRVSYDAGLVSYVISDTVGINPGGTCVTVNPETVSCPGAAIATVVVNAGGANDTIVLDRAT